MSRRVRLVLFTAGAAGMAVLFTWAIHGLPDFGHYHGLYGDAVNAAAPAERQLTEAVGSVTFDYRAVDSLGEEAMLFAAVAGIAVVLREQRDELGAPTVNARPGVAASETSEAVRTIGVVLLPVTFAIGLAVIGHGHLTPGGGFQGGVIVAAALGYLFVAGDVALMARALPADILDPAEAIGLGAYVALGVVGMVAGVAFLDNVFPHGTLGRLTSGGMVPLLSVAVGLEVAAGVVVVVVEFLEQIVRLKRPRTLR